MPLLMIDPGRGALPPEADVLIPGGEAAVIEVAQGQLLSVETPDGGQVAALFAWTAADPGEWLSPHHTRVFGGTFELRMGTGWSRIAAARCSSSGATACAATISSCRRRRRRSRRCGSALEAATFDVPRIATR